MDIQTLKTPSELEAAFSLIKELRPHLDFSGFMDLYQKAHQHNGYILLGSFENQKCLALMGYRILYDFVHGKHVYIDDLIVAPHQQSKGLGAFFLKHAEEIAKKEQCQGLRLCTGKDNTRAIQFYEREGWNPRAYAFKKALEI
mgnify:CR=1 FL=1